MLSDEFNSHTESIVEGPTYGNDPICKIILELCGHMTHEEIERVEFYPYSSRYAMSWVSWLMPF